MSPRYLITHSLLSSWLYAMSDNPYGDSTNEVDPMVEFMTVLRREPLPETEAMLNGLKFENLVTDILFDREIGAEMMKWRDAATKIADMIRGSRLQFKASRVITVGDTQVVLYGRLDALKAGVIYDIKFSGSYERGKFFSSTQHPTYLHIIPEAERFIYLISNGTDVWTETYERESTRSIIPVISDFYTWLGNMNCMEIYKERWRAR